MESKSLFSPPFPKDRRPQPTRNSLCESASEQERNRALRGLPLWCYSERKPDYIWYVYGMNGCKHHVELISDTSRPATDPVLLHPRPQDTPEVRANCTCFQQRCLLTWWHLSGSLLQVCTNAHTPFILPPHPPSLPGCPLHSPTEA